MKEAALGRSRGDAQFTGGFFDRTLLQLANFDRRANSRPQSGKRVAKKSGTFLLGEGVLRIERAVDELEAGTLLPFLIHKFHRYFTRVTIAAELHERRINGDSGKPGGEQGSSVKIIQVDQAAQETFLEGIFGVLPIPGDAKGGMENFL